MFPLTARVGRPVPVPPARRGAKVTDIVVDLSDRRGRGGRADRRRRGPHWARPLEGRAVRPGHGAAFCAATFGLFIRQAWWEPVAIGSATLGLLALIPYWLAARDGGEPLGT